MNKKEQHLEETQQVKQEKTVEKVESKQNADKEEKQSKCNCDNECKCNHKEKNKKSKTKSNKELETLKEENAKLTDKCLRVQAELANIIRRNGEERQNLLKYDGEAFIKGLLPIIDDFDRAIEMDKTENEKFLEGFKLIYANLLKLLEKFEVKEIDCLGKEFDPYTMEAVLRESIITEEPNVVLTVLQKGYMYKDKVIRPAMVKVNE